MTALRAVKPDERPARRRKPRSVVESITHDTRAVFMAMQERIAKAIDDPNIRGADLAALTRRMHELRKEIEAIDARSEQEAHRGGEVEDEAFDASAI